MTLMFRRYLEFFPDVWRDRILAHCDLASKLGIVFFMSLDVGDVGIPADKIEAAIGEAVAMMATAAASADVTVTLEDGKHVALKLRRESSGVLSADIKVGIRSTPTSIR